MPLCLKLESGVKILIAAPYIPMPEGRGFTALSIGIVVELIAMLLGYRGTFFDWVFVLLFSLYTAYDWVKAQAYPKTFDNAVDSAIDIYLDIINLFLRLLSIISKKKD